MDKAQHLRSIKGVVISLVFFLALFPTPGSLHLNLNKPCGDLVCQEYEYCRLFDHTCKPCSVICKEESHNFVKDTCELECQDYIHDERYIRVQNDSGIGGDIPELYKSLQKDVLILKILVGISLIVIAITIAAFIAFVIYFWKFVRSSDNPNNAKVSEKKEKKAKQIDLPTIYNNKYGQEISPVPTLTRKDDSGNNSDSNNSRESPVKSETSMNSINSPGTISTIVNNGSNSALSQRFRREPSESTVPEYISYDNVSLRTQNNQPFSQHV